jgi:Mn2+/Fe2+ NRAMP family transporter
MEIFGVVKYISVPLAAIAVWLLIVKADYKSVERVFLIASAIYLAYIASGVMAHPNWTKVAADFVTPSFKFELAYVTIFVTAIGTTIAPWMQFYQQASIVDKGIKPADYAYERIDVIVGSIFAVVVAGFIIVACSATIFATGKHIETAKDAALALAPLAGKYASTLFAFGLLNASVFSAAILPLSTAYVVCEAFGWESGVDKSFSQAPVFFGTYTALIAIGAGIILLPIPSLIQAMMASQTLNGVVLPVILIVMLRLINDRRLMGKYVNGRVFNFLAWVVVAILIFLTVVLIGLSVMGWLGIAVPGV